MRKDIVNKESLQGLVREGEHGDLMDFFNALDEVFFTVDMVNYRVMRISTACEKLFGYSQTDFLSDPAFWKKTIHPEDKHIIDAEDGALRQGKKVCNEYRIIRKDGSICWVENKVIPTLDAAGNLARLDGVTRDISLRKDAEERQWQSEADLKKSEANLRTIFDNTDTAYVLFTPDLAIQSFNTLAQKFSEQLNREKLVVNHSIQDYFSEERWPFILEKLEQAASGETVSYEISYTRENGSVQWHNIGWLAVKDNGGEIKGYILANKDITEAKIAALEKERITSDLIQHNKDLEQFTYIISHNMRAPVANIIGLADMLKEHDHDALVRKEVIEKVARSVTNLDTVIQDLNNILQAREVAYEEKEQANFRELIDAVRMSINTIAVSENVQFRCYFEEAESIFTVRSYLYSIFYNLSSNSIKFRKSGIAPIITISSRQMKNKVELRFKDNGKGIDLRKYASQVFGLYKRFDNSVEGKGMGLFMVKTQVQALGGNIRVKSTPGEGAEFVIQLPCE